ncbi:MAG: YciI family protein [Lapillicoccus sp.]
MTVVPNRHVTAYGGGMVVVELAFTVSTARLELRPRHREILAELLEAGEVALAGPFDDGSGSMVVFAADRERVGEVLAMDPYYSVDGVTVVAVRELTPLFTN